MRLRIEAPTACGRCSGGTIRSFWGGKWRLEEQEGMPKSVFQNLKAAIIFRSLRLDPSRALLSTRLRLLTQLV
jgi:hypothetical protein